MYQIESKLYSELRFIEDQTQLAPAILAFLDFEDFMRHKDISKAEGNFCLPSAKYLQMQVIRQFSRVHVGECLEWNRYRQAQVDWVMKNGGYSPKVK